MTGDGRELGGTFLGCRIPVESELVKQGWEWRCNADQSKLPQLIYFYAELGFEVCLAPLKLDCLSAECNGCKKGLMESKAVFVRPRK